jgi:hypothetical protein
MAKRKKRSKIIKKEVKKAAKKAAKKSGTKIDRSDVPPSSPVFDLVIHSPRLMRVNISRSSSCRSLGITILNGWPTASSAV